ncbi:phasin family protein [Candidatus Electronema sp. TJ]|uniref:phasin family protein n=1 Tax=Candidatus Electronema sp. TJ TaxID=3401573 RepID=UPI003AA905FB
MKDVLKNVMYAGIGAAFLTRDKLEELGKTLTDKGCLSVDEGKAFVDDLLKKSEAAKGNLEQWIGRKVEERLKTCRCVNADEIDELRRRVSELEAALGRTQDCRQESCGTAAEAKG